MQGSELEALWFYSLGWSLVQVMVVLFFVVQEDWGSQPLKKQNSTTSLHGSSFLGLPYRILNK